MALKRRPRVLVGCLNPGGCQHQNINMVVIKLYIVFKARDLDEGHLERK